MRHAIITGGSKGLGKMVVAKFLENGYSVTINYRSDENRIEELKQDFHSYNECLQFIKGDITQKEDITRIFNQAFEKFGRIDCLINNAGPFVFERKKLVEYTDDEWYEMIEGNLSSVFHFVKLVIPIMRNQKFGRIITYGFQDAEFAPGWIYRSAFSAAKVGLVALTKSIALEEAEHGITANMVCPGDIVGNMKEASIVFSRTIPDRDTPVGRSGTGEDIARLITFLCDEDSDMITGSVIGVTGGIDVLGKHRK